MTDQPSQSRHIGRAWTGHDIEDACPCPQEPCGLVDQDRTHPDCDQHPWRRGKTIRQGHPASECPGPAPARRTTAQQEQTPMPGQPTVYAPEDVTVIHHGGPSGPVIGYQIAAKPVPRPAAPDQRTTRATALGMAARIHTGTSASPHRVIAHAAAYADWLATGRTPEAPVTDAEFEAAVARPQPYRWTGGGIPLDGQP